MGRPAEGWTLRWRRGIGHVRFSHEGHQVEFTTGERDPRAAARAAERIYGKVKAGLLRVSRNPAQGESPLEDLAAEWLAETEPERDAGTQKGYLLYFKVHLVPFFQTVERVTEANLRAYANERLSKVTGSTVRKELSALRGCCRWAVQNKHLAAMPLFPSVPKRMAGTRHPNRRQRLLQVPTERQVQAWLRALPARSERDDFVVRERFEFAYETALRPSTLDRICRDTNYRPGSGSLMLTDADDKARYGREYPLEGKARQLLDRAARRVKPGEPIFGEHDYRQYWRKASLKVFKHERFVGADLRPTRLTHWADKGMPVGVLRELAGHTSINTTNIYVRTDAKTARAWLKRAG